MTNPAGGEDEMARLRDALWQALDDMGNAGLCVCQDTKDLMLAALALSDGDRAEKVERKRDEAIARSATTDLGDALGESIGGARCRGRE
jgi:hypothetical protein